MGYFATTARGSKALIDAAREDDDDYRSLMIAALSDRLAEAAAEWLHRKFADNHGHKAGSGIPELSRPCPERRHSGASG